MWSTVHLCHNWTKTTPSSWQRCWGWTDVIQQWIWLKALWPNENFYPASTFTPDLAKLKYIMRQTTLIQAFIEPFQDDKELIKWVLAVFPLASLLSIKFLLQTVRDLTYVYTGTQLASSLQHGGGSIKICDLASAIQDKRPQGHNQQGLHTVHSRH